jgi:hypothetical protein
MTDSSIITNTVEQGVKMGVDASKLGLAIATAVTGASLASPAFPVIATVLIITATCAKLYAQNKKLSKLFTRSYKLVQQINETYSKLQNIAKNKFSIDIDPEKVKQVTEDINEINDIISKIAGPDTINQIKKDAELKKLDPNKEPAEGISYQKGFFSRLKRMMIPGEAIANFREKLVNLSLSFSILQAEFLIQLTDPDKTDIAQKLADTPNVNPIDVIEDNPDAFDKNLEASQKSINENTEGNPAPIGGRKTRRKINKRKRRTVKNNV